MRPMKNADLADIAQLEQASRPSPWSQKQFATELSSTNSYPLVLIANSEMIGYIILWLIADEIQIQNLVVAQHHRGQKLGELLLNVALKHGLDQGAISAILEVRESNTPAIGLYKKYQFKLVGRRGNYYRDGETALLMTAGPFNTASALEAYKEFVLNRQNQLLECLTAGFDPT